MSLDITIRRAAAADLPALVGLLADDVLGATREDASLPLDPAYERAFGAIVADPNHFLAVAESEGRIVGTLQLTFLPGLSHRGAWRGMIEAVRVAADHRGTGLGAHLFEWAIEQCRARGCHLVQLTTNKDRADAQRFYDRLGFRATHEGYKLKLDR